MSTTTILHSSLSFDHRSALVSTPTSYLSAVPSSSRSSSPRSDVNRDRMTPKSQSQEIHILKLTSDSVRLDSETMMLARHPRPDSADSTFGPPPPSPPASTEHDDEPTWPDPSPSVTFDEPRRFAPRIAPSASYSEASASDSPFVEEPSIRETTHVSMDGHLLAPPPASFKPSRRNTTGSSVHPARPVRSTTIVDALVEDALADDIQQQAEQIRRERLSKRAKAQQAQEAEHTESGGRVLARTTSLLRGPSNRGEQRDDMPLVGNVIGEDHVNYVLMYNMLTGIRTSVSRCQAKIRRPLTDEDYTARHKYSFDIVGNELTPSAKYDFKFKDYAPWVFRELREDYFHLDPADYLSELTAKYILSELGSPGKSGSFFYFSREYRFIIKTIHHSEHKFLRRILRDYHTHVRENPHTLLSWFCGLHRVKLPHGRKIHFVIMNNLFPPHKDVHESYDLKGSTVGREYPEDLASANPRAVLKDLNWIHRGRQLELGPEKRALLTEQLRRDSALLARLNVMDYSLLVGIHNMERGNRDNVRSSTLKVFSPDVPLVRRKTTIVKGPSSPAAIAMRRAMRASDPQRLGSGTAALPAVDVRAQQQFLFYQEEGGLRATDEGNLPMDTIYYLGVIDILTPYTGTKRLEHFWKGLRADRHKISPVPPQEYADRFFAFMKAIMRGGEGGARFEGSGGHAKIE